jgi:predicted nucleotidyltransferase
MMVQHGLGQKTVEALNRVLSRCPKLEKAILFGSRAKGTSRPGSDIDLALLGEELSQRDLNVLYQELDDLPTPYEFSLVLLSKVTDPEIIAHIDRVGLVFYERGHVQGEERAVGPKRMV